MYKMLIFALCIIHQLLLFLLCPYKILPLEGKSYIKLYLKPTDFRSFLQKR